MELKSSGAEQAFESGAVRDTAAGKPIMHLLPPWMWREFVPYGGDVCTFLLTRDPAHLQRLAVQLLGPDAVHLPDLCHWLELGAKRYSAWNWAMGLPVSRCLDSLGRHLIKLGAGLTDEDHRAAALCNIGFIVHYLEEIKAGRLDPKWNDLFDFNRIKT